MPPHLFVHNRFLQTRQHQQRRKKEAEQRNVIHPSPSKAVIPIKQVLVYLSEVANREQVGGIIHRSVHRGHGKVTHDSVAPSEPTIDTILIMILSTGKTEKMKTANACVETTNKIAVRLSGQKPHENGMCIRPNMT